MPGQANCCSPKAMMFTSLSTKTVDLRCWFTKPGTLKASQPGMIGGFEGLPVLCSTGPGRPMPMAIRSASFSLSAASSERMVRTIQPRQDSGPSAMSILVEVRARMLPTRSVTASEAEVAPKSTATTTRALGLRATCADGRPPVDTASVSGAKRPSSSRASMRS